MQYAALGILDVLLEKDYKTTGVGFICTRKNFLVGIIVSVCWVKISAGILKYFSYFFYKNRL